MNELAGYISGNKMRPRPECRRKPRRKLRRRSNPFRTSAGPSRRQAPTASHDRQRAFPIFADVEPLHACNRRTGCGAIREVRIQHHGARAGRCLLAWNECGRRVSFAAASP